MSETLTNSSPGSASATQLPKVYDPAQVEAEIYQLWLDEKAFHAEPSDPGEPYCIVIPPPNVTGALHLGHAMNETLQDILIRVHRMRGYNALWIPGIDHAGIATQAVVEKQLKEKENKTRHDIGREALVERIWAWKEQYANRIIEQIKRLGCSCDWDRTRFTLDEQCARAVRETFFKLFKDGLIYRGKRLVNWDIALQTSISDDEIYHETVKTNLWHIRYPIVDAGFTTENTESTEKRQGNAKGNKENFSPPFSVSSAPSAVQSSSTPPRYMTVATTRPETMLGDTAVAVHSGDPRWNWAIGKFVELPLTGRKIPIIADDILVDPKFGSGVVKVTPAHDPNDYGVWQRHQTKPDQIDIINILNSDGTLNNNAGAYAGMKRDAARKMVVAELEKLGLLEKEEPYETQVGHSDRSKTPVEPYLSDQWFIKMAPLAEPALEAVRDKIVRFFPERYAQTYLSWLGEKRDWPISRQLWWGHRIPVWRHDSPPDDLLQWLRIQSSSLVHCIQSDSGFFIGTMDELIAKRLETWGAVQDPDVLDTWFSSALWPHSTLGWPEPTQELVTWYPTRALVTSRDIITLWVARMVMAGLYNLGEVPFGDVHIHTTILDGKGERMSKTKGNGVDPVDIADSHGADGLRFVLTQMATETQDARLPVQLVCPHCKEKFPNPETTAPGGNCPKCKRHYTRALGTAIGTPEAPLAKPTSEKFDLGRNFCNKLWNAARFALANLESVPAADVNTSQWSLADRWIVSRFNHTVEEADLALAAYRFDHYAKLLYDFFWRDFCDWYVEATKPAMKDPAAAPQTGNVLAAVLDGVLRLLHPVIPFITEAIWMRLEAVRPARGLPGFIECPPNDRLIKAAWPAAGKVDDAAEAIFAKLQEIIVAIRNVRNEYKADARKPVTVSVIAAGDAAGWIQSNRRIIELLATCELKHIGSDISAPDAVRVTAAGCEILIEGVVDQQAEKERINKQCEDLARTIRALRGRLANEAYISKAPAHLVEQSRQQLAEAEAEFEKQGCAARIAL